jgi:hypothetical protein
MSLRPLVALLLWASVGLPSGPDSVLRTRHNLSRSGPGPIRSATDQDPCGFCHVPHGAEPKESLWGHRLSAASYKLYRSDTLNAVVEAPNGASKLCLSCHDGTIALGDRERADAGLGKLPPGSPGYLGTDLSGTHPVSMVVDQSLVDLNNRDSFSLRAMEEMRRDPDGVRLDAGARMQCTTCHDPHSDGRRGSSGVPFWRKPTFSEVCLVCHQL